MAEARQRTEWARAGEIAAAIYNVHRDPKKKRRPFVSADFNPFAKKQKQTAKKQVSLAELKSMMGG